MKNYLCIAKSIVKPVGINFQHRSKDTETDGSCCHYDCVVFSWKTRIDNFLNIIYCRHRLLWCCWSIVLQQIGIREITYSQYINIWLTVEKNNLNDIHIILCWKCMATTDTLINIFKVKITICWGPLLLITYMYHLAWLCLFSLMPLCIKPFP